VDVQPGGDRSSWTLQQYSARYRATMSPSGCRAAKGLMLFTTTDTSASADWRRKSIERVGDLGVRGSSLTGDQQIRQFAREAEAIRFLDQQRRWFADCSDVRYDFGGSVVDYSGTVDTDAPDMLLTSATTSGGDSSAEFDGWTRVGTVVYGAFLLGDGSATQSVVRDAGRTVLEAAAARLRAAG
jgi:hypothetical protein